MKVNIANSFFGRLLFWLTLYKISRCQAFSTISRTHSL